MKIIKFDELASTQDKTIELIDEGKYIEKSFIVADNQLKGRGRSHTVWISARECLTFSYAVKEKQSVLNILTNIKKTLNTFDIDTEIKWPNDIILQENKIGGVVINDHKAFNIVGIGINLSGKLGYTTIESVLGKKIDKNDFLAVYSKFYESKNKISMQIPNLWFEGEIYEVKKVNDEYLLLVNGYKEEICVSAYEYSYEKRLNRIIKK